MRRPAGVKGAALLTASLLLVPYIAALQPHEQIYHRESPHENGPADDQSTEAGFSPGLRNGQRMDTTQYRNGKDTNIIDLGNKASAVATNPVALAGHDSRAVRAVQPAQRGSGKHAGLSTPLQARSLQDWEVEDFVLLATVDGSIHARDRKTGNPKWELEVDKPMVETTYHTQNKSQLDGSRPEYDFLWIVEPSRDGEIYIYNQGGLGGLQKLHMTVKQLVADMSPYESMDPAVVYNGEKRTKLYTVDAETGTISKVFGSGGTLSKEPRCPRPGGLDLLDDEECGSGGSFVLGRTEYIITIQNRDTTEPLCTLKYSEWGPNARDGDLHSQYAETKDNRYIYTLHDGSIFGWNHGDVGKWRQSYTQKLSSPVVRVFDVARPLQTDDRDPQLIVLPQPIGPLDQEPAYSSIDVKNRIFVNRTSAGGWFAMSENTYPLVTGRAKEALCYDKDWLEWTSSTHCSLDKRQEGFIGVHALSELEPRRGSPLTISGHGLNQQNEETLPEPYAEISRIPTTPALDRSWILSGARDNPYDTLIILAVILLSYLLWNRPRLLKAFNSNIKFRNPLIIADPGTLSVPSSPTVTQSTWSQEPETIDEARQNVAEENGKTIQRSKSRTSTLVDLPPEVKRARSISLNDRVRAEGEKGVRFEVSPPAFVDGEQFDPSQSPQLGKKKARRGARGGVKHKKKRADSQNGSKDGVDETVKEIMQLPEENKIQPDQPRVVAPTVADMIDPDGTLRIGHLTVKTDTVLGYGGHGTMVYKGTFGGRDVAVKRMLREFYEIASHEVGLLQESDDHPNVVRYYDKEEDSQFFYIALELCPASLQDIVERPQDFLELMKSSPDQPDMLRQITAGLHYLHSLKIVHRDIKPQNILISAPKANPLLPSATPKARLLISDFGLCKKLEADQNSFRATTAHAAGTSGWRAPELLVDDDPSLQKVSSTTTDTNNSETLVIDSQTRRSATRAIDIFSLGCIFYYCLTNGQHPFDKQDKFMREANIVKGTYNIDALGCLGDYQWEARDLIESMLRHNPKQRPDSGSILRHPFFWSPEERLQFLCDVSDSFEHEKYQLDLYIKDHAGTDAFSQHIDYLESCADQVIEGDFQRALPHEFKESLGKQRKYKGGSLLDLLRALRNKRNHYEDMSENLKRQIGGPTEGYLSFWTRRFPNLLLTCWRIIEDVEWTTKDRYKRYYIGKDM
ncbi:uncharacterized protein KY384_009007 [Bacidia gigantensis]|uniref:uncharacterized protein n=1 Tax=Bacidia gigantensis TaxID=2732470 RepID=UPI001D04EB1E|nr:uncharacterized protein KY384_009007 [Bacidia gigantensis]KAG8525363.1 hypothetical protein KY384_009007 [Bacidia gigantensis]